MALPAARASVQQCERRTRRQAAGEGARYDRSEGVANRGRLICGNHERRSVVVLLAMDPVVPEGIEVDDSSWPLLVWTLHRHVSLEAVDHYLRYASLRKEHCVARAFVVDVSRIEYPGAAERGRIVEVASGHRAYLSTYVSAIAIVTKHPAFRFALSTVVLALPWLPPAAVHPDLRAAGNWCRRRQLGVKSTTPPRSRGYGRER